MWARRLDLSAKALLQMVHLKGFSPGRKNFLLGRLPTLKIYVLYKLYLYRASR